MRTLLLSLALFAAAPAFAQGKKPAAEALTPEEAQEIRTLMRKVMSRKPGKAAEAAARIKEIGLKAEMAIPALERAFKRKPGKRGGGARAAALDALVGLAKDGSARALAVIIKALPKAKEEKLKIELIDSLKALGKQARPAGKSLLKIIKSSKEPASVRREAMAALGIIGAGKKLKGYEEPLRQALASSDEMVSLEAAMAMVRLQVKDPQLLPLLLKVIKNPKGIDDTRQRAIEALGGLGPEAAPAVADLIAIVEHKIEETFNPALPYGSARKVQNDKMRKAAVVTLGLIGPKAKAAEACIDGTRGEAMLNRVAIEALEKIRGG